jgi:endonuclease/exonuclease/phosphatase family metal-dependent hydrolase
MAPMALSGANVWCVSVRVGTWNVQYGLGSMKNGRRRQVLDERDADVWVLTETSDQLDLSDGYEPVHSTRRYGPKNAGRWVTIWSRLPLMARVATQDSSRTVAATFDTGADGPVCVYGTVLPWHRDQGPDGVNPAPNWQEFYRITPLQGDEWRRLRSCEPLATLVVAGDLNHSLGGKHYYGTARGRALLREMLATASLTCLTETDSFAAGQLEWPPIDHICASAPPHRDLKVAVEGWRKTTPDGLALSDHSGVLADIQIV